MAMGAAAFVCAIIPLLLLVYFKRRKGAEVLPFFVGCAVFVLFALVIEGALNYLFSTTETGKKVLANVWTYALYGGLMAGVFEETGRFIAFKTVLRKRLENDANALSYGAGHGGIEAIITVSVTYFTYIVFAVMINSGMGSLLTQSLPAEQAEAMKTVFDQLAEQPWWYYLAAILERSIAIIGHICLSVLVWFAAKKRGKFLLFPLAILLHAAMDFIVVVAAKYFELPVLAVEGVLAAFAVLLVILAFAVWKANAGKPGEKTEPEYEI